MGITGLLPFVKSASKECHISEFRGQTVAIDAYCWLHKGAFGCASKLAKGEETDMFVSYCLKYVDLLKSERINPILVFDGRNLPAKAETERKRRENRDLARKRAAECLRLGKTNEAYTHFKRCVDVTPEMALMLIKACRNKQVDCIVAPYEADAQLAFLNKLNIANFIISEDSDLLLFGCQKILFKLDITGHGTLVDAEKLHTAFQETPERFNMDRFRYMCILSGCDYLDSLPGIGLKKAQKFLNLVNVDDIYNVLPRIPEKLKMNLIVTKEYQEQFMVADATFRHQLVFDPINRCLRHLTDPEACNTKQEYLRNAGELLDKDMAFQMAMGNLNPFTLKFMDNWSPDEALKSHKNPTRSIWCKTFTPHQPSFPKVVAQTPNAKRKYSAEDIKQENEEYDAKLMLELSSYNLREQPSSKKICLSPKHESQSEEESVSPSLSRGIAKRNPFLRKRSFGNFKSTVIDDKTCVVSKYFNKSKEVAEQKEDEENEICDKNETNCILIENLPSEPKPSSVIIDKSSDKPVLPDTTVKIPKVVLEKQKSQRNRKLKPSPKDKLKQLTLNSMFKNMQK